MSAGADRLAEVRRRIEAAARSAGRDPAELTLVAVSKTHGAEAVREMLEAGQRVFGENRVQEAQEKFPDLKAAYSDLELHLIGPLQTNKARDAVKLFDVIQSVDRERLAAALAKEMAHVGRRPPVLHARPRPPRDVHRGDVLAGEGVRGVRDQQARLADGAASSRRE